MSHESLKQLAKARTAMRLRHIESFPRIVGGTDGVLSKQVLML
jgi:hypothetical protein